MGGWVAKRGARAMVPIHLEMISNQSIQINRPLCGKKRVWRISIPTRKSIRIIDEITENASPRDKFGHPDWEM